MYIYVEYVGLFREVQVDVEVIESMCDLIEGQAATDNGNTRQSKLAMMPCHVMRLLILKIFRDFRSNIFIISQGNERKKENKPTLHMRSKSHFDP